jgi:hypothetical protein
MPLNECEAVVSLVDLQYSICFLRRGLRDLGMRKTLAVPLKIRGQPRQKLFDLRDVAASEIHCLGETLNPTFFVYSDCVAFSEDRSALDQAHCGQAMCVTMGNDE